MSEDFSGGAVIVSLDRYRAERARPKRSYPDRVEELKGKILEAVGLGFVSGDFHLDATRHMM